MPVPERLPWQSLRNADPVEASKPPRLTLVGRLNAVRALLSISNDVER